MYNEKNRNVRKAINVLGPFISLNCLLNRTEMFKQNIHSIKFIYKHRIIKRFLWQI